jgi:hypothetical protein
MSPITYTETPALIRAKLWVMEYEGADGLEVQHHHDAAGVGWVVVRPMGVRRSAGARKSYVLSPRGRVWRQNEYALLDPTARLEPPIRLAEED